MLESDPDKTDPGGVIDLQNELKLTEKISLNIKNYHGRPYKVVYTDKISEKLVNSIENDQLKKVKLDYISLIQNLEGIDMTDNQKILNKLLS